MFSIPTVCYVKTVKTCSEGNNSTNIDKTTDNHFSPQIVKHKQTPDDADGNPGLDLRPTNKFVIYFS